MRTYKQSVTATQVDARLAEMSEALDRIEGAVRETATSGRE